MKYFDTYFRIKSAYHGYFGFENDEQKEAFHAEVAAAFANDGWEIIPGNGSGDCMTAKKGKQELYLHPMYFSGVICEDSIEHLHTLLSAPELSTFSCYHVDVYNEYKDMTDKEYLSLLYAQKDAIVSALLEVCRTKRKNLFATGNIPDMVTKRFSVPRLGVRKGYDKENLVVSEIFLQLIGTGKIAVTTTKNGVGYRTTVKKEEAA